MSFINARYERSLLPVNPPENSQEDDQPRIILQQRSFLLKFFLKVFLVFTNKKSREKG